MHAITSLSSMAPPIHSGSTRLNRPRQTLLERFLTNGQINVTAAK